MKLHRWQRDMLKMYDLLRLKPGRSLRLVHGRKRSYLAVIERDGKEVEGTGQ